MDAPLPLELEAEVLVDRGPGARLLVLLHGYRLPASDLTERLSLLDPGGRCTVVVPTGPYDRKGRAIWHRALLSAPEEAAAQFHQSVRSLDALLGRLAVDHGADLDRAVVGGFSQGGGLAIALLMAAGLEHRPGAAFGVCSFAPAFPGFVVDRAAVSGREGVSGRERVSGRACFLASARRDRFAPIESSRAGAVLLAELGLDLTYVETDSEHVMTDEAATAVGAWLERLDTEPNRRDGHELFAGVAGRHEFYDGLWEYTN
jgi:predicted esterase